MNEVMTPSQFAMEMNKLKEYNTHDDKLDIEYFHIEADKLMCELLESLGYDFGVNIFRYTKKWYA